MAKVTSKRRVTIAKALAERYGIRPGDEIRWVSDGGAIRIELGSPMPPLTIEERLRLFDESVERQNRRQARRRHLKNPLDRGWKREELHDRDRG